MGIGRAGDWCVTDYQRMDGPSRCPMPPVGAGAPAGPPLSANQGAAARSKGPTRGSAPTVSWCTPASWSSPRHRRGRRPCRPDAIRKPPSIPGTDTEVGRYDPDPHLQGNRYKTYQTARG
jgi:hypothetical protein